MGRKMFWNNEKSTKNIINDSQLNFRELMRSKALSFLLFCKKILGFNPRCVVALHNMRVFAYTIIDFIKLNTHLQTEWFANRSRQTTSCWSLVLTQNNSSVDNWWVRNVDVTLKQFTNHLVCK